MRFPELEGRPILISWQASPRAYRGKLESGGSRGREVHAGGFLRDRRIVLDSALRRQPALLRRILVHEIFHFAWARLGNPRRRSFERLLAAERRRRLSGELGWSAECRKLALRPADLRSRSRRWREYVCESFCDSAAWLFSNAGASREFTLAAEARRRRRRWFVEHGLARRISV
jgi:hypothetical protein